MQATLQRMIVPRHHEAKSVPVWEYGEKSSRNCFYCKVSPVDSRTVYCKKGYNLTYQNFPYSHSYTIILKRNKPVTLKPCINCIDFLNDWNAP